MGNLRSRRSQLGPLALLDSLLVAWKFSRERQMIIARCAIHPDNQSIEPFHPVRLSALLRPKIVSSRFAPPSARCADTPPEE
jgi:hypothetical protein